jgi:hypothetical protein
VKGVEFFVVVAVVVVVDDGPRLCLPHQANARILSAVANRLELSEEKIILDSSWRKTNREL